MVDSSKGDSKSPLHSAPSKSSWCRNTQKIPYCMYTTILSIFSSSYMGITCGLIYGLRYFAVLATHLPSFMPPRPKKSKDQSAEPGLNIDQLSDKDKRDLLARLSADMKKDKASGQSTITERGRAQRLTTSLQQRKRGGAVSRSPRLQLRRRIKHSSSRKAVLRQRHRRPPRRRMRARLVSKSLHHRSEHVPLPTLPRTTTNRASTLVGRVVMRRSLSPVRIRHAPRDRTDAFTARNHEPETSPPPSTPVAKSKKRSLPESDDEEQESSPSGTDTTPVPKKSRGTAPVQVRCPMPEGPAFLTQRQLSVNAARALKPAARQGRAKTALGTAAQPVEISSDVEDTLIQDIVAEYTPYKQVVNPADKNKPRLEDFSPTTKKLGKKLRALFALYLALEDMFPEDEAANAKVDKLWAQMTGKAAAGSKIARRGTRYDMEEDYQDDIRNAVRAL